MVDWFIDCLIGWLAWLVGCLVGWLCAWLLVGCFLARWLAKLSTVLLGVRADGGTVRSLVPHLRHADAFCCARPLADHLCMGARVYA